MPEKAQVPPVGVLISFGFVPGRSRAALFASVLGGVSSKEVVPIYVLQVVSQ